MSSFFGFLKKMAQGKPIYDDNGIDPQTVPSANQPAAPQPQPTSPNGIQKGHADTFPVVRFRHIDCRLNGQNMELYGHIANESGSRIILDRLRAFSVTRRITDDLRSGEEHPYLIYSGPLLTRQDRDAYLTYRTEAGDYFEARHDVDFTFHNDSKTYSVDSMRLHLPIRDIYG